jgi:hypothetical protein
MPVNFVHLDVVYVARGAASTSINKSFMRFENNAVRSHHFAVGPNRCLRTRIIGTPLCAGGFGGNVRQQESQTERKESSRENKLLHSFPPQSEFEFLHGKPGSSEDPVN